MIICTIVRLNRIPGISGIIVICVGAIADDNEGHKYTPVDFHPINNGSKTFHWLLVIAIEFARWFSEIVFRYVVNLPQ